MSDNLTINPETATEQDVFNFVVGSLFKQGRPSIVPGAIGPIGCKYRLPTPDGTLKCGIGFLIPDAEYSENIEGCNVDDLLHLPVAPPSLKLLEQRLSPRDGAEWLRGLQRVHDGSAQYGVEEWKTSVRTRALDFAHRYGLDASIVSAEAR